MKQAIITGATSMLGAALIRQCIQNDISVLAVANPSSKRKDAVPVGERVRVLECPLNELKALPSLAEKAGFFRADDSISTCERESVFFHLAWAATDHEGRNSIYPHIDNITYTIDAAEAAWVLGCKRFVGAGSQAEYGRKSEALRGDTPTDPETPYGAAKLCAGQMSRIRCAQLGLEHVWTRILSAYGPNDGEHTLISSFIRSLKKGEHFATTKGEQLWDYIYCDDAARALYLVGEKGIDGKVYPIGSGIARPLREYIETVKEIVAPEVEIGYGEVPYGERQVMHLLADISELTEDTGFAPETPFETGIRKMV